MDTCVTARNAILSTFALPQPEAGPLAKILSPVLQVPVLALLRSAKRAVRGVLNTLRRQKFDADLVCIT